jgi:hypothetical protein
MSFVKTELELLVAQIATAGEVVANKITSWSSVASDTKYPSESLIKGSFATAAETTAGTSAVKLVTASSLAHSDFGKREIQIKVLDDATLLTTGEGKVVFCIPSELNGYNLVGAQAYVSTISSSGLPSIGIRNVTDSVEMLTVNITIDVSGYTSYVATTPPTIDTAHDDVATGDLIAVDIDTAGTGTKGLGVILNFQLP